MEEGALDGLYLGVIKKIGSKELCHSINLSFHNALRLAPRTSLSAALSFHSCVTYGMSSSTQHLLLLAWMYYVTLDKSVC